MARNISQVDDKLHPKSQILNHFARNISQLSHKQLLELLRYGSLQERKEVFEVIYKSYHKDVWRFIKTHMSSEDEAKDIFASIWLTALQKLPDFDWDDDNPPKTDTPIKSWLLTVAHLKCFEHFRKRKKEDHQTIPLDESIAVPERFKDSIEAENPIEGKNSNANELVSRFLSSLKPREQKLILLIYEEEKNSREVALSLNMTPAAVRKAHARILNKLQKQYLQYLYMKK